MVDPDRRLALLSRRPWLVLLGSLSRRGCWTASRCQFQPLVYSTSRLLTITILVMQNGLRVITLGYPCRLLLFTVSYLHLLIHCTITINLSVFQLCKGLNCGTHCGMGYIWVRNTYCKGLRSVSFNPLWTISRFLLFQRRHLYSALFSTLTLPESESLLLLFSPFCFSPLFLLLFLPLLLDLQDKTDNYFSFFHHYFYFVFLLYFQMDWAIFWHVWTDLSLNNRCV